MVDFKKRLRAKASVRALDPVAIYDSLDRASDKGPLRPVQQYVLSNWHQSLREKRDLIVKLHTGQGKTLIGLLMLQSRIHEGKGAAVYLCPNHFLVDQTCTQARQFGIAVVTAQEELPHDFVDGHAILVTTVHKLFNGLTRFGIGPHSLPVGTLVMDDCHTCIDVIKDACSMTLPANTRPYEEIVRLFSDDLRQERAGTFSDIQRGEFDAILAVPYWAWTDHNNEVTNILSSHKHLDQIRFSWPLLRDMLERCACVVSGASLEIVPYAAPLYLFGSYYEASHRVFMSATVTDDSFLVKGLGLEPETIRSPLLFPEEKWCGEKMVLIPSLIDRSLNRDKVVKGLGKPRAARNYGVVALCPSFRHSEKWKGAGARVPDTKSISETVDTLKAGQCSLAVCVVNRYDGIDLPDDACRILILDSRPMGTSVYDRYAEFCRPGSEVMSRRMARIVEQGMGRSVRGEKDYCVIVLVGVDLVHAVRSGDVRKHYSAQTQKQIEIGLEIASLAKEEIAEGESPPKALGGLIRKVLDRDEGWKVFYAERMSALGPERADDTMLKIFSVEASAERKAEAGRLEEAATEIQTLVDETNFPPAEKGWYLQEMARYMYGCRKSESGRLQAAAHNLNRYLLKPREGVVVKRLGVIRQKRVEAIREWIAASHDFEDLTVRVEKILSNLRFGADSDSFEMAVCDLGQALGFASERPDAAWGAGPDNLWCLRENDYLLIECKSEVQIGRDRVSKSEAGQMNTSCAWFEEHYGRAGFAALLVFPGRKTAKGASLTYDVKTMRQTELNRLVRNVRRFFCEFASVDLRDLEPKIIQKWLREHKLDTEDIPGEYSVSFARD